VGRPLVGCGQLWHWVRHHNAGAERHPPGLRLACAWTSDYQPMRGPDIGGDADFQPRIGQALSNDRGGKRLDRDCYCHWCGRASTGCRCARRGDCRMLLLSMCGRFLVSRGEQLRGRWPMTFLLGLERFLFSSLLSGSSPRHLQYRCLRSTGLEIINFVGSSIQPAAQYF